MLVGYEIDESNATRMFSQRFRGLRIIVFVVKAKLNGVRKGGKSEPLKHARGSSRAEEESLTLGH